MAKRASSSTPTSSTSPPNARNLLASSFERMPGTESERAYNRAVAAALKV